MTDLKGGLEKIRSPKLDRLNYFDKFYFWKNFSAVFCIFLKKFDLKKIKQKINMVFLPFCIHYENEHTKKAGGVAKSVYVFV